MKMKMWVLIKLRGAAIKTMKGEGGFMTFQGHMGGEGLTIGSWGVGTSFVYHFIVCNSFNMIL